MYGQFGNGRQVTPQTHTSTRAPGAPQLGSQPQAGQSYMGGGGNPYSRIQPGAPQGGSMYGQQQAATAPIGAGAGSMYGGARVQSQPMRRPMAPPPQQPAKPAGGGGMMGMASGMMGMSDERSKAEIAKLEGANDALTKALSVKTEYPNAGAPSSGMQALGQQDSLGPMQARFADTPAANKVAAQNVGLQQPAQPMAMQPSPQQSNFGRSTSPAFQNVQGAPPDLSALDEAYKRMGQGG